ncbi:hypothetical protein RBG61_02555 [Paludicola sp. MB14-C6]|uniref:hypothetical protein n=1 Tax=Paludihabitans sp. MB14-C6 TaxID=3070656 RepID=UPI0027DC4B35|nr:hypothetical protein [Paludicola sp. MB14-C6]WMJ23574.1 hypothetical protein RBG61_02555 [Paludicola sp. MB14-C6]
MELPKRKRIRLQGFDYSKNGIYFITICTNNRLNLFCTITDDILHLTQCGFIIEKHIGCLNKINQGISVLNTILCPITYIC